MKVILLEDIEKLGKKYEIKEVADGYARNFLIPKNLVKLATKENMQWIEEQKNLITQKSEEELKEFQELASKVDGLEVAMPVKIGTEGQLFESVTGQKISDRLKELGFEIKKNQIEIKEPIKELGEFPIKIKFEHNLEAEIKIIVSEDKLQ